LPIGDEAYISACRVRAAPSFDVEVKRDQNFLFERREIWV